MSAVDRCLEEFDQSVAVERAIDDRQCALRWLVMHITAMSLAFPILDSRIWEEGDGQGSDNAFHTARTALQAPTVRQQSRGRTMEHSVGMQNEVRIDTGSHAFVPDQAGYGSVVVYPVGMMSRGVELPRGNQLLVIGRGPDAMLRLRDSAVSARHCMLLWQRGGLVVVDLMSRNGTRVNGKLVGRCHVHPGDLIGVGNLYLEIAPVQSDPTGEL